MPPKTCDVITSYHGKAACSTEVGLVERTDFESDNEATWKNVTQQRPDARRVTLTANSRDLMFGKPGKMVQS